jgi:hypothetical protein
MKTRLAVVLVLASLAGALACTSPTASRSVNAIEVLRPGDTTAVNPAEINYLNRGQSMQLAAWARLSDGSRLDVTGSAVWSSNNNSVMSVAAGLVTGVNPGVAIIEARLNAVEGSASFVMLPQ